MLVAVLSDIHSNPAALSAVLRDVEWAGAQEVWLLGDTFGYHPWAARTFELVAPHATLAVIGNHDRWVLEPASAPSNVVGTIARQNALDLITSSPAGMEWLGGLPAKLTVERRGWTITLVHGTPSSPLDGRYYPDDRSRHRWLPRAGEIVLLGQTHRPINRGTAETGLLLNPGSVGQPRDGRPIPSWALLDLDTGTAELRRTAYDANGIVEQLRRQSWDETIVKALARDPHTPTGA